MKNNQNITDDNQHYVPQFLFNNFHILKKIVFLHYKKYGNNKIKPKAIKSICSKPNYFNIYSNNVKSIFKLDPLFKKSEHIASEIIAKIISSNFEVKSITSNEKKAISEFIAYLYLRMYAVRKHAEKIVREAGLGQFYLYQNYLIFSKDMDTVFKSIHASFIPYLSLNLELLDFYHRFDQIDERQAKMTEILNRYLPPESLS